MKNKDTMKVLKRFACLAAVCGALTAVGTGCRSVYVDQQGRVVHIEDNRIQDTCDVLNATGNFLTGAGDAASGAGDILHGIGDIQRARHHRPRYYAPVRCYGW